MTLDLKRINQGPSQFKEGKCALSRGSSQKRKCGVDAERIERAKWGCNSTSILGTCTLIQCRNILIYYIIILYIYMRLYIRVWVLEL